mmetsp:Transcript_26785/g.48276  ORF Transcript_26785/g.48276 Transcript_26785/m.48276 type:complete len:464 (+) Transcript_26785:3-1394(+)
MEEPRKETRLVSPSRAETMKKLSERRKSTSREEAAMKRQVLKDINEVLKEDELELLNGLSFTKEAEERAKIKELRKDKVKSLKHFKQEIMDREQARSIVLDKKQAKPSIDPLSSYPGWSGNKPSEVKKDNLEKPPQPAKPDTTAFIKNFVNLSVKYTNTPKFASNSKPDLEQGNKENVQPAGLNDTSRGDPTDQSLSSAKPRLPFQPANSSRVEVQPSREARTVSQPRTTRSPLKSLPVHQHQNRGERDRPPTSRNEVQPSREARTSCQSRTSRSPLRSLPVHQHHNRGERDRPPPRGRPENHAQETGQRQRVHFDQKAQENKPMFPMRRGRDPSPVNPIEKRLKRRESEVIDILSETSNKIISFYRRLESAVEFMPNEAHYFNVLIHAMCKHPKMTEENSLLKSKALCKVEAVNDGLQITLGLDVSKGMKTYLGVKVNSNPSKKLRYWTRESGEKTLQYLDN